MNARAKTSLSLLLPLGLLGLVWWAELSTKKPSDALSAMAPKAEPAWEGEDFSKVKLGGLPDGWEAPVGTFGVVKLDGKNVLEFRHEPMVEGRVLLPGIMPGGGAVRARLRGDKARRASPRFGVGLTQDKTNFQLRAQPDAEKLELFMNEQSLTSVPWTWQEAGWLWLELSVRPIENGAAEEWEGRCWLDGTSRPEAAMLVYRSPTPPRLLRASLHLAPYALKSIYVNAVETRPLSP